MADIIVDHCLFVISRSRFQTQNDMAAHSEIRQFIGAHHQTLNDLNTFSWKCISEMQ